MVATGEQLVPARNLRDAVAEIMQAIEVGDRGEGGLDPRVGRPESLAALAEQALSGFLDAAPGLAPAEDPLRDRRLLKPFDPEQHGGYSLDDRVDLLFLVAQPHQDGGRRP